MKISEIAKLLLRLGSFDRDIESWAEEFNRVMNSQILMTLEKCLLGQKNVFLDDQKE